MYTENNTTQPTSHETMNSVSDTSQQKPQTQQVRCANCDIDILWTPVVVQDKTYCCTGCAAGGPCSCDYSQYRSITVSGVIRYVP